MSGSNRNYKSSRSFLSSFALILAENSRPGEELIRSSGFLAESPGPGHPLAGILKAEASVTRPIREDL